MDQMASDDRYWVRATVYISLLRNCPSIEYCPSLEVAPALRPAIAGRRDSAAIQTRMVPPDGAREGKQLDDPLGNQAQAGAL